MPLFEFVFRAFYDNPFSKITESNPSVQLYQWCNDRHDVIELVMQKPEDYGQVREEFSKSVEIVDEIDNGANVHVITRMCACGGVGTVMSYLNDPTLLVIPPVAYENGWEYFRVIAFRHEGITKLVTKLREAGFNVQILRKTPFDGYMASSLTLSTDTLFSGLTEKQIDALLTAYAQGYFRFPRGSDLQTIASKEKIGRTTFLEHLKKAENKIITALIPHIQLFRKVPQERKNTMRLVVDAS
jgi:predicted DNA binding protein